MFVAVLKNCPIRLLWWMMICESKIENKNIFDQSNVQKSAKKRGKREKILQTTIKLCTTTQMGG